MTTSQLSYVKDQLNRNYTVRDQNGNIDIEKTKAEITRLNYELEQFELDLFPEEGKDD